LVADRVPLVISVQVCHEFLSVMTRQPLGAVCALTVTEALTALDGWRGPCAVLKDDDAVLTALLELVRKHDVKGKQVHAANIVATMRANGIDRLATLNGAELTLRKRHAKKRLSGQDLSVLSSQGAGAAHRCSALFYFAGSGSDPLSVPSSGSLRNTSM
jgi:hypothetical protein